MIQWPGGRERWRKQGEQLHTFFPPQKIFVCLETKASRQEGFWWNQTFSPPWPFRVIYSSCWSKLCPESPRTCKAAAANSAAAQDKFYAGLWHGLILLQEPIYQKHPLFFPLLVTPYPPYSRDNSASYSRVNTKEIAGTKKDRGQNFIGFGVLFAVTQNGCRRKNPIKLMWSEQSPESTGRRQRKDRGIVSTITTALRTGGHTRPAANMGKKWDSVGATLSHKTFAVCFW